MDIVHTFKKSDKDTLTVFLLFIPIVVFFTVLAIFMVIR